MFRCFFPDEYLESAYAVNYEKLYQEGVRGLLFDIDNTLAVSYTHLTLPTIRLV